MDEPAHGALPSSLRGLGPKSDAMLARIGNHSARQLREQDPFDNRILSTSIAG